MKKRFRQFIRWIKPKIRVITPGKNAVRGASLGLLIIAGLLWIAFSVRLYVNLGDPWILLFCLGFLLVFILAGFLIRWAIGRLNAIPKFLKLGLLISIPSFFFVTSFDDILVVFFVLISALAGAGIAVFRKTGWRNLSNPKKVITALGVLIGIAGFIAAGVFYSRKGFDLDPIENAALAAPELPAPLQLASPAEKGPYPVKTLTYGSGSDRHRPEYGEDVDIKTTPVNGLAFIDGWEGFGGWWRENYWGFDVKSLPINARVWYPDGEGPFPLALIVHGNHGMQDYSDPGYQYLGELLASRGIILASVDENFINGSWSDIFGGLDTENDARGWLLLEHLKVWHQWNESDGHPFEGKIDTGNLSLIGHSRGGEAVAHAAMFNALPYYPDDASVVFDYNYDIRSIVAIAPVDGQYESGNTLTKVENVDYFVIHGGQDGDVSSFMGAQQFERMKFTDSLPHFKSAVYVYGANHGQFNTSWGDNDFFTTFTGQLNLQQLMPAEEQQRVAEVYISAFLDITLRDQREYIPLFLDARKGKEWLPETIYLSHFEDSSFRPVAEFDEDFDLSTLTEGAGKATSENLTVWREQEIKLKWRKKGSRALVLGWDYSSILDTEKGDKDEGDKGEGDENKTEDEMPLGETIPDSLLASYTITLDSLDVGSGNALVFNMAESTESSDPKSKGKWVENNEEEDSEDAEGEEDDEGEDEDNDNNGEEDDDKDGDGDEDGDNDDDGDEDEEDEKKAKEPLDFSIRLTDSKGVSATVALSSFSPLQREIEVLILKTGMLGDGKESEKVFQTFYFPIEDFQRIHPDLDLTHITGISFLFDQSEKGVVVIDKVGFMDGF